MTVLPGVAGVEGGFSRGSMDTRPPLHTKLIKKDQSKKSQSYKVESVSGGANTDMHNFSLESKRETEYVSHHQRYSKFCSKTQCCIYLVGEEL